MRSRRRGIPENELFEAMHTMRRKLVTWLRERASQAELDLVMEGEYMSIS